MTDTPETIAEKTNRLEQIINQLEEGSVSLERADELYTEGQRLLEELETELDVGDGKVIEQS